MGCWWTESSRRLNHHFRRLFTTSPKRPQHRQCFTICPSSGRKHRLPRHSQCSSIIILNLRPNSLTSKTMELGRPSHIISATISTIGSILFILGKQKKTTQWLTRWTLQTRENYWQRRHPSKNVIILYLTISILYHHTTSLCLCHNSVCKHPSEARARASGKICGNYKDDMCGNSFKFAQNYAQNDRMLENGWFCLSASLNSTNESYAEKEEGDKGYFGSWPYWGWNPNRRWQCAAINVHKVFPVGNTAAR